MYVFVANGYKGIIESKQVLDVMSSIYPYPKFRKVRSREDAINFLARYDRGQVQPNFDNYGDTDKNFGFAKINYVIDKDNLYVTIDTSKVGFIRINPNSMSDVTVDNRPTMIRVIINDIHLNNDLISDHCVAITAIMELLGGYVDVNIVVPDISIYLALTKYSGDSYIIKESQDVLRSRLGGVSITID